LHPETALSGEAEEDLHSADVDAVLDEIKAAMAEEAERQQRLREAEEPD
jgi:RIO kinase 1